MPARQLSNVRRDSEPLSAEPCRRLTPDAAVAPQLIPSCQID
jgi:hypothetical protein